MSEIKYRFWASDLESTGLLAHLRKQGETARLHNFCALEIKDKNFEDIQMFHPHTKKSKQDLQDFIDAPENIFIMHNGLCYDMLALEFFGFDISKMKVIDTLPLSFYLANNRERHGLEVWGEEFGVPKPKIDDWESLTQKDYDNRVIEDCKIQRLLWMKFCREFGEMYGCKNQTDVYLHRVNKYLQSKMRQLQEQEINKWLFDVDKGQALFDKLLGQVDERTDRLKSVMPKVAKFAERKMPAKCYLKNGALSEAGKKWKKVTEDAGLPFGYRGVIKVVTKYEEPNPASSIQIKKWLESLGWTPETFDYKREPDGSVRAIPQISKKNSGGDVCQSIKALIEDNPEVSALQGLGIVKHRYSMVKGWLENHEDGFLVAGASGFTNTLRLKHRNLVNLPSGRVPFGLEIRGLLKAREGCILTGSDLSSLENRWKFHHQYPLDPDFVLSQMSDDFDPHMALAVAGGLMTEDDMNFYKIFEAGHEYKEEWKTGELDRRYEKAKSDEDWMHSEIKRIAKIRAVGKQGNYALQYGSGVETLARTAKITIKEAKKLKSGYDKLNWSIPVIANNQKVKSFKHGKYLLNPVNNIYYPLKADKDKFSTLIQGSGSYTLDLWISKFNTIRKKAIATGRIKFARLLGTFHDELIIESAEEDAEEIKAMLLEAIDKVNESLKLFVPIACDIKQGKDYSEIH